MDAQLLFAARGFTFIMQVLKPRTHTFFMVLPAMLAAFVGHPDTAQAQNGIAFSPNPVQFTSMVNSPVIQSKDVSVTVNGLPATSLSGTGTAPFSITARVEPTQSVLTVIADSSGRQPGVYNGTINVVANGLTASLPVTLTVYSANTITLGTNTLTFNGSTGGPLPASQTVSVQGSVTGIPFAVTSATATGGAWLSTAQTGTVVPASIVVSVNPSGLAPGTYNGTVTVTSDQIAPQIINVTFVIFSQQVLVVTPNPVSLLYQTGIGAPAPSATIQIQTTLSSLNYTGTVNYTSCGSWFTVVSGLSGVTNSQLILTANLGVIGNNQQCAGSITISAPGTANSPVTVPVTFQSSTLPLLSVNPTSANFSYSVGGTVPPPLNFSVASSGSTALNYNIASSVNWLMIPATPPNGFATPSTFQLGLNASVLSTYNPGTYNGVVSLTAFGSGNSPVNIPVTLTVSNNPLVTVTPNFLNFNYQVGTNVPGSLAVNVASTMGSVPFTISVPSTTSTQFVAFTPASGTATTTPTPLTISLNQAVVSTLGVGTYTNQVQVSGGSGSQTLQVNLTISTTPLINVSPQQLFFTYDLNGPQPAVQTLAIASTDGSSLPVIVSSNQAFLLASGSSSSTPAVVNVGVDTRGLAPGIYSGQVTILSGNQTQTVPVSLTVRSGVTLTAAPASLSFTQAAGGAAPSGQTVTLATTGNAALPYSVSASTSSGGGWLAVNGTLNFSGNAPGTFSVTASAGQLAPGTYNGMILITAVGSSNQSVSIPVTLTVTAQTLAAAPASLTFNTAIQGAVPAPQTLNVTSTTGSAIAFTAAAQATGGNWLSVTPANGTTPQNITVSVNQAGLAAGTYMGSVRLTSTVAGAVTLVIPVTLTVGAQAAPVLSQVQNAASFANGPIAPGEVISLFGTNLGPVTPATLALTPQGTVSTNLANVQVLFDGIAAPLTYVSAIQINAVVPYEVFGRPTTTVVVNFNGVNAAALQVNVGATAPGIFTLTGTQAAVLNQNGTVNGAANPAVKGSTVVIYATGEGQTNPAGTTGTVTGTTLKNPVALPTLTIGGQPATITYVGSAPGLVSGVLQINAVVPAGAPSGGAVPVVVTIGTASSQPNSTIAVQ